MTSSVVLLPPRAFSSLTGLRRLASPVRWMIVLLLLAAATDATGQWTPQNTSGHISNTNPGNVGIGTPNPAHKLDVLGPSVRFGDGGSLNINFNMPAANTYAARFQTNNTDRLTITGTGNVGIGNPFPAYRLEVAGSSRFSGPTIVSSNTTGTPVIQVNQENTSGGYYLFQGTTSPVPPSTAYVDRFHVDANGGAYFGGEVVIGASTAAPYALKLIVHGDADVKGNIALKYQDLAEWVPSTADLSPGMVVVLNPGGRNEVMASSIPYDTRVAGVVSAQPGIILGEEGDGKEKIATTGRVLVRVDASAAPVAVGDLLVTSGKPGMAMRSEALEIQGRRFHQPGTIIGKALEPLNSGQGEILVLLSLQ